MYLKSTKTGEIFAYSPFIAALPEMVPCELNGSIPDVCVKEAMEEPTIATDVPVDPEGGIRKRRVK